jgi:hypothetical protein
MRDRGSALVPATAVGLVVVAAGLLFAQGEISFGSVPDEIHGPADTLAFVAAVAAATAALVVRPARIPVGLAVLTVTALVALGGAVGVLAFYDAGGTAVALGIASLVALWLVLAGRRVHRPWSHDLPRRLLSYVCVGVVVVPVSLVVGLGVSCSGSSAEDDLCGAGWFVFGLPATIALLLLAMVAAEVAAARHRHRVARPDPHQEPTSADLPT